MTPHDPPTFEAVAECRRLRAMLSLDEAIRYHALHGHVPRELPRLVRMAVLAEIDAEIAPGCQRERTRKGAAA